MSLLGKDNILGMIKELSPSDEAITRSWGKGRVQTDPLWQKITGMKPKFSNTEGAKIGEGGQNIMSYGPVNALGGRYVWLFTTWGKRGTPEVSKIEHYQIRTDHPKDKPVVEGTKDNLTIDGIPAIKIPEDYTTAKQLIALILGYSKDGLKSDQVREDLAKISGLMTQAANDQKNGKTPVIDLKVSLKDQYAALTVVLSSLLDPALRMTPSTPKGAIVIGTPGMGKTYNILKIIREMGLVEGSDYTYVQGAKLTALGMFEMLEENPEAAFIFDDSDSVFGEEAGINMLKAALDSNPTRTLTIKNKQVDKSFQFTGTCIFLSNLPKNKINSALFSRSSFFNLWMTAEEILEALEDTHLHVGSKLPKDALPDEMKTRIWHTLRDDASKPGMEILASQFSLRFLEYCYGNYVAAANSHVKAGGKYTDFDDIFSKYQAFQKVQLFNLLKGE